jgi:plastocyanin
MHEMRRALFPLVALLAIGATACSDGSSTSAGGSQSSDDGGAIITQSPTGGSGGCTDATATDLSGDDPFTITIENFRWNPDCVKVSGAAAITIENKDAVDHTFTIPDTQVDAPLPGNDTFNGESAGLAPGTYGFMCTIHPTITGTIIVV